MGNAKQPFDSYTQPAELKACEAATAMIDLHGLDASQDGLKAARALHGYATTQAVQQILRVELKYNEGPWTQHEALAANCSSATNEVDPFVFGSGISLGRASLLSKKFA